MSERYVAEYVEIIDSHGERKGVCVTDTEHTVSFEVKDEYVARELCDLLNELFEHNLHLQRLIESLAKVTGEPIEDTIERYNNNPVIFHRDQNRKYAIQGFCKWVVEDGRYETLYYGDGQDISNLIDEYLENDDGCV